MLAIDEEPLCFINRNNIKKYIPITFELVRHFFRLKGRSIEWNKIITWLLYSPYLCKTYKTF